ncbi:hypothetical protein [Parachryseolinea silvisoli]|uniref:hypothetical protein n=1 Tax=Parachryseolinea silvisoli TaxID=2873601 RepID=UPI002265ADA0|nr:hypothetical protein [Parachryseolinea silvisoli]MCD9015206.1 hypothetical protein [Parachryseolinea silvisoli]
MAGFYISKISVGGPNKKPAEIVFKPGCNVVTGASDTGKSYIFALIHYLFGKSELPKNIPESAGYEFAMVEIRAFDDDFVTTLYRAFGKNIVYAKYCGLDVFFKSDAVSKEFKTKGDVSGASHISSFLMHLSGLENKKVLRSKSKGKTENLSFASLRNLLWIDEEEIIRQSSPFYFSGDYSSYTRDQSTLKVLLSGEDFNNVKPKEDKVIKEKKITSKIEFALSRINAYTVERKLAVDTLNSATGGNPDSLTSLNSKLEIDLVELDRITNEIYLFQSKKTGTLTELAYTNELSRRFKVLSQQYKSDFERLEFILEADILSSQLGDTACPVCSSKINEAAFTHMREVDDFRQAGKTEIQKLSDKRHGLESTIIDVIRKQLDLEDELLGIDETITYLTNLSDQMQPRIEDTKGILTELLAQQKIANKIEFIDDEVQGYYKELDRLQRHLQAKEKEEELTVIDYFYLIDLSKFIEERLRLWNYDTNLSVVFNPHYTTFDIVISGKERRSFGKGKRSISFAACVLGLLDYCMAKERPLHKLVILDSPLTTFEEKTSETKSELANAIQSAFFKDLSRTPKDCQIIIFDNKRPAPELHRKLNVQEFTGNPSIGRNGFFP